MKKWNFCKFVLRSRRPSVCLSRLLTVKTAIATAWLVWTLLLCSFLKSKCHQHQLWYLTNSLTKCLDTDVILDHFTAIGQFVLFRSRASMRVDTMSIALCRVAANWFAVHLSMTRRADWISPSQWTYTFALYFFLLCCDGEKMLHSYECSAT